MVKGAATAARARQVKGVKGGRHHRIPLKTGHCSARVKRSRKPHDQYFAAGHRYPASVILSRVAQGEEFVVTDQGQAVARIVPPDAPGSHPLSHANWQTQFDLWMQEVDSRAARYPNGFNLDDSRESIYNGRGT